jgi:glutamate-1-semialdehyde 2,1-aminomutase
MTVATSHPTASADRLIERAKRIRETEMVRLLNGPRGPPACSSGHPDSAFRSRAVVPENAALPVVLDAREGSHVWDQDGREYLDFHNGFGAMVVGHAHPRVVEAIAHAAGRGTHFAVTTEVAVEFGEEICRRFHLEAIRFANSGTEATMDAIRVARAATGRDVVCKIEGSYHGHHDAVMFSVCPTPT